MELLRYTADRPMRAVDIIRAKRDGEALSREAIDAFVRGVTDGSWEDYQSSAVPMAIVLAPLAASCGVVVPKMSGRGLGHTGGTLDKLESIPGFRVALSLDEFKRMLGEVGCCLISQTATIVPADKKLYALRDVTATI